MTYYNHCVIGLKHKETGNYKYYYKRIGDNQNMAKWNYGTWEQTFLMAYATKKRALEMAEHFNYCHLINGTSDHYDFTVLWKYNRDFIHNDILTLSIDGAFLDIEFDLKKIANDFLKYISDNNYKLENGYVMENLAWYIQDELGKFGIMGYAKNFYKYSDTLCFDYDDFNRYNDEIIERTLIECVYDYMQYEHLIEGVA